MKLFVYIGSTIFSLISCFLLTNVQGQFGNNGYQQRNQYGNPLNDYLDGLKNQVASNLFRPNLYGVGGYGAGFPQQQNPWTNPYQQPQHQGGYNNQFTGNPTYQNQHPYNPNQGQYNPNSYQQQGGTNFGPGQQQGGANFGPGQQQGGANFGPGQQQNYQGPLSSGQPPLQQRENLGGQGALPVPNNTNSPVPSGNNVQSSPNPNGLSPQPNNIPAPIDTRDELAQQNGENSPTNSEDAQVLKEFNNSS